MSQLFRNNVPRSKPINWVQTRRQDPSFCSLISPIAYVDSKQTACPVLTLSSCCSHQGIPEPIHCYFLLFALRCSRTSNRPPPPPNRKRCTVANPSRLLSAVLAPRLPKAKGRAHALLSYCASLCARKAGLIRICTIM
ncbi:hypothetical protein SCLCIDRAFT_695548 [Scleroderma citrinum Foug A]|uniref:Uncharacterized protein n=1 Tax=Scleroderma citrinum Foug A TaxID=1036808 RepID=A0A0C3CQT9_9AGAM|nr:hypothetical protein SCLCIDRAFT_695548 [Scleroderma citrinum Foug A]